MNRPLRDFISSVQFALGFAKGEDWARIWIRYRFLFHDIYLRGRILSTAHGADIFDNVEKCLNGAKWIEPSEVQEPGKPKPPENEYGKNFRAVIKEALDAERKAAIVSE